MRQEQMVGKRLIGNLQRVAYRRDAEFVQAYERERTQHERVYRAAGARAYEDAPPTQDPVSVRRSSRDMLSYGAQQPTEHQATRAGSVPQVDDSLGAGQHLRNS